MKTILPSRIRPICTMIVVLINLSMVLQACQMATSFPTPTINTAEESPTETETLQATKTSEPSPTSQTATAVPITATPAQDIDKDLDTVLIDGANWYVGIETMDGERIYARDTEEIFFPASMIKIPIAMVTMKILEYRGDTVQDIHKYGIGRNFSALLEAMVVKSEDGATETLENFANGYGRLRSYLDWWGLKHTFFHPRRSTVEDLLLALELINTQSTLNEEYNKYLLEMMSTYTENDETLLGVMLDELPDCVFYNKRGTMASPMVVADMGILACGDQTWYLVIAGTPTGLGTASYEGIQASIEDFGRVFRTYVQAQLNNN